MPNEAFEMFVTKWYPVNFSEDPSWVVRLWNERR